MSNDDAENNDDAANNAGAVDDDNTAMKVRTSDVVVKSQNEKLQFLMFLALTNLSQGNYILTANHALKN